jgi:hypothetical protein
MAIPILLFCNNSHILIRVQKKLLKKPYIIYIYIFIYILKKTPKKKQKQKLN